MGLKELEKLLQIAVKYGVKRLKTQDVEIEIGAGPSEPGKLLPSKVEISDEDMLMWSVETSNPSKES